MNNGQFCNFQTLITIMRGYYNVTIRGRAASRLIVNYFSSNKSMTNHDKIASSTNFNFIFVTGRHRSDKSLQVKPI